MERDRVGEKEKQGETFVSSLHEPVLEHWVRNQGLEAPHFFLLDYGEGVLPVFSSIEAERGRLERQPTVTNISTKL